MKQYKGYNVPDTEEFVSEQTKAFFIVMDYCKRGVIKHCTSIKCKECLFSKENLTKQWHEERLKEAKDES